MRLDGHLAFNDGDMILASALAGQGVAYMFEEQVAEHIAEGRLVRMLEPCCPTLPGHYLYHPSRRQTTAARSAFIEALRSRLHQQEKRAPGKPSPPRKLSRTCSMNNYVREATGIIEGETKQVSSETF